MENCGKDGVKGGREETGDKGKKDVQEGRKEAGKEDGIDTH